MILNEQLQVVAPPTQNNQSMTENDVTFWRNHARATAANLGVRGDDLDDVAQDALVDVLKAWDRPTGNRKDYLSRVVRNCVIDWFRVRSYRQHLSIDDGPRLWGSITKRSHGSEHDPFPSFESIRESASPPESVIVDYIVCKDIIENASPRDAQILNLFGMGHSDSQIAEMLGMTAQGVKIVIARIRRQMRRACSDSDLD